MKLRHLNKPVNQIPFSKPMFLENPGLVSFIKTVMPSWFYGINETRFYLKTGYYLLVACLKGNLPKHGENSKIGSKMCL